MPYLNPDAAQALDLAVGCRHHDRASLNRLIDQPNISIGHHTNANGFAPPQDWAAHLAPVLALVRMGDWSRWRGGISRRGEAARRCHLDRR